VQLHQVQPVDAQVGAAAVGPGTQVLGRERLRHVRVGAAPALRRHGDVGTALGEEARDELLAAPVAVDVGGVEEGDPGVDGRVQHRERVGVVDTPPVGTQLPAPQPDDGHLTAGAAEHSIFHERQGSHTNQGLLPGRYMHTPATSATPAAASTIHPIGATTSPA
jgi:hypothetical protein